MTLTPALPEIDELAAATMRPVPAGAGGEQAVLPAPGQPLRPRPQQVQALTDLTTALAMHDRAQLVMACGTGKTLVGRWHAQAAGAERVLVFLPSLALLAQTLREWRRAAGWPFEALVVCSDASTAAGAAERLSDDGALAEVDEPVWAQAKATVTTSIGRAARFLERKVPGRPQVVFSTYHSAPVVAAAQAQADVVFDLALCDEAHRLAGRPREAFRLVLDRRRILARKRVFMTATPQDVDGDDDVISMSDPALFGPVAHTVSFGAAIEAGLLSDYQVVVIAERDGEPSLPDAAGTLPAALLAAVDRYDIRRMLTFHSRVARAAEFAATMDAVHTPRRGWVRARHVSGKDPAVERADALRWLGEPQDYQVRVVSSARCLAEGVDVPAVDAVLFADQRESAIDIIQAVGRVLRPAPGKSCGTIIIPVALPADGDDDTNLALSPFAHVWAVLRGLRAHDQRLADELDTAVREGVRRSGQRRASDRIRFELPHDLDQLAVHLRLVQEVGSEWEKFYTATRDWITLHDGARLAFNTMHAGVRIGEWAVRQRQARRRNMLGGDRIARLQQLPGWYWDRADADWDDTYQLLLSYADVHGTIADHPAGASRFAKARSCGGVRLRLGVWLALQRQWYRDGLLGDDRARLLEKLPGWDWANGLRQRDIDMIQALRVFFEFEKHADVPDEHREDGLPLGAWLWAVRREKLLDRLPPALADELIAATGRDAKGGDLLRWESDETQWRLSYAALRQFIDREQRLPTGKARESIEGTVVCLGQWVARQRMLYRRGELDARYAAWLQALPGWQWEISLLRVAYGTPIDLGDHPHGTAKGVQAGCRCRPCLELRRLYHRGYVARKRQLTDPVPAAAARRHILRLEDGGAKRATIAAVAAVPLGVVRKVAAGQWRQLERRHAHLIAQVTAELCAAAQDRVDSRGRRLSSGNEIIDATGTFGLLDDLNARGFDMAWVSRELGYVGGLRLHRRSGKVTRRIADQIAALHTQVGDLVVQRRGGSRRLPPLAELRAQAGGPA